MVPGTSPPDRSRRCATGIPGLDEVLVGGFPPHRFYLVQGDPGTGKTTLAIQFLLEGVRAGERGLYITLSETKVELTGVADSHGWDLSGVAVRDHSAIEHQLSSDSQNTMFHPSEVELNQTTGVILAEVERIKPSRVVFDSMSEMRLLAQNSLRFRRQMLALKQYFIGRSCTVLFLDDNTTGENDRNMQSLVHGVIKMEQASPEFGAQRHRLNVLKIRGSTYRGGFHDYLIGRGGLTVFPRLIAAQHHREYDPRGLSSGIARLDALLDGGLDRGTSNLFMGPAGTGKSTFASQFAVAAAARGEKAVYYLFDENQKTWQKRCESIGLGVEPHLASGAIRSQQIDPAELTPGEFASQVQRDVLRDHVQLVIIDSLNGYLNAMPEDRQLALQLHELLAFLSQQGVVTILTLAQHGLMGTMQTPVDVTYIADTVVVFRYFEAYGQVRKAVSVIKKRSGSHEKSIREYQIDRSGISLGEPLNDFHGVLTGVPTYRGDADKMMKDQGHAVRGQPS
jgi:circadian clock protein KaiC